MSFPTEEGTEVVYCPPRGKPRRGVLSGDFDLGDSRMVLLEGDPFSVILPERLLEICTKIPIHVSSQEKVSESKSSPNRKESSMTETATKPGAKELRKEAQALGVTGWEDMGRSELAAAVKAASKTTSKNGSTPSSNGTAKKLKKAKIKKAAEAEEAPVAKKVKTKKKASKAKAEAPAKKKASKTPVSDKINKKVAAKAESSDFGISLVSGKTPKKLPAEGENPFRKSSNLYKIAKLLLKGGVRATLAESLAKSAELNPYTKDSTEIDLNDYDKRLLLGSITMRDTYGYGIFRSGRGINGKILVFIPGGSKDPRTTKKAKKK